MRSFRSKPVGWRGESYRHYLAAKGIKTRTRFFSPKAEEVQFVRDEVLNQHIKKGQNYGVPIENAQKKFGIWLTDNQKEELYEDIEEQQEIDDWEKEKREGVWK